MYTNPLITVAVPVYNGENYLAEALTSIFQQDYGNFEVIVVDDGSDNELSIRGIVEKFNDSRIKFFRKENGGVASALNQVLREMNGDFLAWLSHDDLFAPNKLSIQVESLQDIDSDEEILFSGYNLINAQGNKLNELDFTAQILDCSRLGGLERGLINGCTVLISKTILLEVGMFDESLKYTQDYDYWLRCLKIGKKFRYISQPLVSTRQHPDQDTNKNRLPARIEAEKLWVEILNFWLAKSPKNLDLDLSEMLDFRTFLQKNGFESAEQEINLNLKDKVSPYLVSVVVPVVDRIFQLERALKSLQSQIHENFEVVIIEDSSIPDTKISKLVGAQNFSIKHIQNIENVGAGPSRNTGIKNAKGAFICFLDSDDFFLPDKIFEQLVKMIAHKAVISHTNYFSRDQVEHRYNFNDTSIHSGYNQAIFIAKYGCSIATPTVMISQELVAENKTPFAVTKSPGEDISAWISLLHKSSSSLLHIELPLTIVTSHTNSAAKSSSAQIESRVTIQKTLDGLGINVNLDGHKFLSTDAYPHTIFHRFQIKILKVFTNVCLKICLPIWLRFPERYRNKMKKSSILKRVFDILTKP
jgi:glycosyltransferase involved in cell wall biosynthesis